jgi:histidyl-tRNA synthetase
VGLGADDIAVKISSREMLAALLQTIGIAESELEPLYAVLDKRSKLPRDTFEEMLTEQVADENKRNKIIELMAIESIEQISDCLQLSKTAKKSVDELSRLFELLGVMGVADFCVFDIGIVRGLAYYTGIVYEIYDRGEELRAIGGGGRFDNLLRDFGGPDIPATGFGIGDCVLGILLEEKGLLKPEQQKLDYFVACVAPALSQEDAVKLAAKLRTKGCSADFSYKFTNLSKQLKQASERNAKKCIIIGDEYKNNELVVKDMASGQQELVNADEFLSQLKC